MLSCLSRAARWAHLALSRLSNPNYSIKFTVCAMQFVRRHNKQGLVELDSATLCVAQLSSLYVDD